MKKFFLILCALLLVMVSVRLFFHYTDGFLVTHITPHFKKNSLWEVKSPENPALVDRILKQKFTYLDKGHQSYVFESADKEWVIKFPKFQRYRLPFWITIWPLPEKWEKKRASESSFKQEKLKWIFDSWKISYEEFSQETGVPFVHLNPEEDAEPQWLVIVDKAGITRSVDLSKLSYLIQRKGVVLDVFLEDKQTPVSEAKVMLQKVVALYVKTYQAGYSEKDPHILRNTGIIEGNPIYLDPARFIKDATMQNPQVWEKEILKKTTSLRKWIDKNYPELTGMIEKEIKVYVP